jgi:hypothetical protein
MSGGHRSFRVVSCAVAAAGLTLAAAGVGAQSTQHLIISARVGPRTAVRTSASVLHVDPGAGPGPSIVGAIDVEACARTRTDGEVILTVEALASVDDLAGGAASGAVVIEYAGSEPGMLSGALSRVPQVAGRWTGSGVRRGTLTFTLRSAGPVAGGSLPLRFLLSVP